MNDNIPMTLDGAGVVLVEVYSVGIERQCRKKEENRWRERDCVMVGGSLEGCRCALDWFGIYYLENRGSVDVQ